ncbi:unnamed protein product [Durusdinium trenchii]|uniref:JmjC domain-containing protein n=1 Tax=Durusdinium trenchii TaxID=1381693 RepID=A0ABP0N020_9DINO
MGGFWTKLLLLAAASARAEETCAADGSCTSSSSRDKACRDVLELVPAGTKKLWTRSEPAVVADAVLASNWDKEAFSYQGMRSAFGDTALKVFSPAQAALLDGQTSRLHPLRHILSKLGGPQQIYVFDNDFFLNASAQAIAPIPDSNHLLQHVASKKQEWLRMSNAKAFLTLGGPLSGTQFHSHGPAFLLLASGKKRWYLHPPGRFPNRSAVALHRPMTFFETKVLDALEDSVPLSCVQSAGDAIFVPDGWSHATINVEKTLGVAWQRTTSEIDSCNLGHDYWCLAQRFSSAEKLSLKKQGPRYKELFLEADQLTEGFPVGFLRHLTPYWKTSPEDAKETFKSLRLKVLKFLKDARRSSDEALLAAALLKRLADVLFTVRKDARRASDLLAAAQKKAPEAGQGPALARLLGQQFRWKEASEALELHLVHFPEDSGAVPWACLGWPATMPESHRMQKKVCDACLGRRWLSTVLTICLGRIEYV